jgi:hypothetical protein
MPFAQDPDCEQENTLFSRQASYILGHLQLTTVEERQLGEERVAIDAEQGATESQRQTQ